MCLTAWFAIREWTTDFLMTTSIDTLVIVITVITNVFYTKHTEAASCADFVAAAETGLGTVGVFGAFGAD